MAPTALFLAAVAAAGLDFGLAHPGLPQHGGLLREAPAVDDEDQARLMEASEIARVLGGARVSPGAGAQHLRSAVRKPVDVTHGKMCSAGPDTSSEKALRTTARKAVDALYDMVNKSGWVHHGSDSSKEWSKEGGATEGFAHVYGEVERDGMFDILKTAACIAEPKKCTNSSTKDLVALFRTFHFYDLGSGQGKFPVYASLLGFEYSKGIELDQHRCAYAERVEQEFNSVYPCLSRKLGLEHGSFLKSDASWTRSSTRRIVFLSGVLFKEMWPEISRMVSQGKSTWGPGSVVVALGREFVEGTTGLLFRESTRVPTSWTNGADGTTANFYSFPAR